MEYILEKSIVFSKKIQKSLSIIVFKGYCVCWVLLKFISIKFCQECLFSCLRLYITPGYWTTDQLLLLFFSFGRYVASPARAKLDQDIVKFCFIKKTIEQFICSYWKSAWFEKTVSVSETVLYSEYCYWYGRFTTCIHKETKCLLLLLQFNT